MKKAMQFSLICDKLRGSPAAVINLVVVLGIVIMVFTVCMIETTCDCMFETVIAPCLQQEVVQLQVCSHLGDGLSF